MPTPRREIVRPVCGCDIGRVRAAKGAALVVVVCVAIGCSKTSPSTNGGANEDARAFTGDGDLAAVVSDVGSPAKDGTQGQDVKAGSDGAAAGGTTGAAGAGGTV